MMADFDHQILSRHTFGIVDPVELEGLPEGIKTFPLVPDLIPASAHLMPHLLDFRCMAQEHADYLLNRFAEADGRGDVPPISMLVKVDSTQEAFANRWNMLQLRETEAIGRAWIRLHDPRVLHQVLYILSPSQRRRMLGSADSFTYWLGDRWVEARHPRDGSAPARGDHSWDWERVARIGIVNRILAGAEITSADDIDRHLPMVELLLDRARLTWKLTSNADLVEFGLRGITIGERFDSHPDIEQAIRGSGFNAEASLSDRLGLLPAHVWDQVRTKQ